MIWLAPIVSCTLSFLFISISANALDVYKSDNNAVHTIDGLLAQYPADYDEARARFQKRAKDLQNLFPTIQIGYYHIPSALEKRLTTDHLFIPAPQSHKLVIISSGIHGAEGPTGHTLQLLFLDKMLREKRLPNYNVLLIHALNPYGFKYFRRTNEKNVDLNRNFATEQEFKSTNVEYGKLRYLLEPDYIASSYTFAKIGFFAQLGWVNLTKGRKEILGSLRGQYQFPEGLFYGGAGEQAENRAVQTLLKHFTKNMQTIYHVDIHTGFGEKSKLHFFGSPALKTEKYKPLVDKIFADNPIDTGDDKNFYATTGDFGHWLMQSNPNKTVIPITFEFGTMNSQTLLGGLTSLWITVLDNQGHHRGYLSKEDNKISRKHLEKLFNPQSAEWQKAVLERGYEALNESLSGFEQI